MLWCRIDLFDILLCQRLVTPSSPIYHPILNVLSKFFWVVDLPPTNLLDITSVLQCWLGRILGLSVFFGFSSKTYIRGVRCMSHRKRSSWAEIRLFCGPINSVLQYLVLLISLQFMKNLSILISRGIFSSLTSLKKVVYGKCSRICLFL